MCTVTNLYCTNLYYNIINVALDNQNIDIEIKVTTINSLKYVDDIGF